MGRGSWCATCCWTFRRLQLGVRDLVTVIEQSIVQLIDPYGVSAEARPEAPGVYVDGRKLAALGLRIRKGCSYHGLSLNVDMDLDPLLEHQSLRL